MFALCFAEAAGGARTWHSATHVTHSDPPTHAIFVFGGERPRTRGNERDEVDCVAAPMLLETDLMLWFAPTTYGKAPTGRAGHSATFVDGRVVIFGGCAGRKWCVEQRGGGGGEDLWSALARFFSSSLSSSSFLCLSLSNGVLLISVVVVVDSCLFSQTLTQAERNLHARPRSLALAKD